MLINMNNIKDFIESYGNISDLAKRSGLNRSYIYRILNGEQEPGMKFIQGMVNAGMRKQDIFDDALI